MPAPGAYSRSSLGADVTLLGMAAAGGNTAWEMKDINNAWCARFRGLDTRDVKSVWINWGTVQVAGTVTLRVETIDAATGKPSGSLYDASATKTFTPTAGWQNVVFDALPTTGLDSSNEFGIVLITASAGTAHALRSHTSAASPGGFYPLCVLTATDGSTRSNFAETGAGIPCCTVVLDDDVEEVLFFNQFATLANLNIFTTNAAGMLFTVPTGITMSVLGIYALIQKVGTPAGDLRCRILNSADSTVGGTTINADKDSLIGSLSLRRFAPYFAAPVSLGSGTYRIVLDSSGSANSSNCWRAIGGVARASGNVPSSCITTETTDVTAGPPITWTDTNTQQFAGGLLIDSLPTGGSSGMLFTPNLEGV